MSKGDPYGIKLFEQLVDELWKTRDQWQIKDGFVGEIDFDYPDYGGIPKRLSNRLSSEIVDQIHVDSIETIGR